MSFQDFFKLDRPLTQPEIHQLIAGAILSFTESDRPMQAAELVNTESCAVQLGATGSDREKFRHINSESFPNLANTFVNSLLRIGILEHYWVAGPNLYKLNPNRKATLETLTTLEVLEASEFVETLHDDELRVRCESMLINTGSPDTLIREASTVLEDRLRQLVDGKVDRRDLSAKALHPTAGTKNDIFADTALQEDFFYLVRGVLGLYGTPAHHGLQEDVSQQTATRVVAMIDEILETLSIT